MSISSDPDQTQLFVRPDLGPNCLQRVSTDDKNLPITTHLLQTAHMKRAENIPSYRT